VAGADPNVPLASLPSAAPPPPLHRPPGVVILLLGVVGGAAGVLAAIYQEVLRGGLLAPILVAPAVEEVCKPIGVLFILEKRPHWLRSRTHVVLLAALGALVFATLENLIYIHVYHPEAPAGFVLFRYTVCTGVHLAASTIFAVGLAKMWRHIRRTGGGFDIDVCLWHYAGAVALHAAYNALVILLHLVKVLRF